MEFQATRKTTSLRSLDMRVLAFLLLLEVKLHSTLLAHTIMQEEN